MKLELQLLIDDRPFALDTDRMTLDIIRTGKTAPSVVVTEIVGNVTNEITFELKPENEKEN